MPRYQISWTEEQWYTAEIEADSVEEARDMVLLAGFDWPDPYGYEVQDSIEVEELDD